MGKIEDFLRIKSDSSYGSGCGSGSSDGCGDGSGDGCGYGDGYGCGSGDGSGSGCGDGCGCGCGSGYGDSDSDGIKSINGDKVYDIDNINTIITSARDNIARGFILESDLSLIPCFVVRGNNKFAHGSTLREAFESLQEKLYDDSTEEERIERFKDKFKDFSKKYKANDLFVYHHILTGSCKMGRESFCRDKGINVEKDTFTIYEFIELTKDSYNGEIIKKLLE